MTEHRLQRSETEIIADLLSLAKINSVFDGASKTFLRKQARLNPQIAKKYFEKLEREKLIRKGQVSGRYFLTPKGNKRLDVIRAQQERGQA